MITNLYLIISKTGRTRIVKTRQNDLRIDEVCLKLNLNIPNIMFEKPQLQANITVDEKSCQPTNITPEIIIKTRELIEQTMGMKIDLKVVPFKEDK